MFRIISIFPAIFLEANALKNARDYPHNQTPKTVMRFRLLLVRFLILFALAVSAGQLADHISGAGAFCEFGDTCDQVTTSAYGKPLGVPLPAVGLIGFGLLFALTLVPTRWAVRLIRLLGVLAGAIGIGLLVIQFTILHKVCPLCLLVDSASIGVAVVAAIGLPEPLALSRFRLLGWILVAAITVLVPVCWTGVIMPDPVPDQVQKYWVVGEITIVDVTDFECPHCRQADAVLRDVLSRHKVRFVRLVAPMPLHENGPPAARAYIAARQLGKGEEMAAALYAADSRTSARCRELAAKLGLNLSEYDRVLDDSATDAEYHATVTWVRNSGSGLPLIWVQNQLISGVPTVERLEDAIRKAKPLVR
ncbi:MAG TPA: vitamin K epoxide reductase family protein [Gemmata sp.]|nr:vitamin K epoxide reductase family protein [Gemmata sp.]